MSEPAKRCLRAISARFVFTSSLSFKDCPGSKREHLAGLGIALKVLVEHCGSLIAPVAPAPSRGRCNKVAGLQRFVVTSRPRFDHLHSTAPPSTAVAYAGVRHTRQLQSVSPSELTAQPADAGIGGGGMLGTRRRTVC